MMKRIFVSLSLSLSLVFLAGCSANPNVRAGQTTGALVGGAAGGLLTDSWGGAAVGAAMGSLVGGELRR